jgi:hypothetical protein
MRAVPAIDASYRTSGHQFNLVSQPDSKDIFLKTLRDASKSEALNEATIQRGDVGPY